MAETYTMYHVVHEHRGFADIAFKTLEEAHGEIERMANHENEYWQSKAKTCHIEKVTTVREIVK